MQELLKIYLLGPTSCTVNKNILIELIDNLHASADYQTKMTTFRDNICAYSLAVEPEAGRGLGLKARRQIQAGVAITCYSGEVTDLLPSPGKAWTMLLGDGFLGRGVAGTKLYLDGSVMPTGSQAGLMAWCNTETDETLCNCTGRYAPLGDDVGGLGIWTLVSKRVIEPGEFLHYFYGGTFRV